MESYGATTRLNAGIIFEVYHSTGLNENSISKCCMREPKKQRLNESGTLVIKIGTVVISLYTLNAYNISR